MASAKREFVSDEEPKHELKKPKLETSELNHPREATSQQRVLINPADCDLDFNIEDDGLKGSGLHGKGFAYCWSGARANVGITGGRYCFSCKIISSQPVDMEDTPTNQQHLCRLGISRGDDPVGNLGETMNSFGFGGTGKFSNSGNFLHYGETFGVGDTIVCAVNLENKSAATIGFSKNGKWLGVAKNFNAGLKGLAVGNPSRKGLAWEFGVFPHVLLKNVVVQLQFGVEDGLVLVDGYKPWTSALGDGNAVMGPAFLNTCGEVMMMVGLPASGKTTWAEKWVKSHPAKRYILLGTNLVLDQMKVPGLLRKQNYGERFDRLMGRANPIFDILLSKASKTPRNYIIDQTNVFKSARKRKLRPFSKFRKIAVVVFPRPGELKVRANKRFKEMGKEVPADAVNNMLANYVLPTSKDMPSSDEFFDEVIFSELDRVESQRFLDEMKHGLRENSTPYSDISSVKSAAASSPMNQAALLAAGGGYMQSSHNASFKTPPPRSLSHTFEFATKVQNSCNPLNVQYGNSPETYGAYGACSSISHGPPGAYERPIRNGDGSYYPSYGSFPTERINPYSRYGAEFVGDRTNLYQSYGGDDPMSSAYGRVIRPQSRAQVYLHDVPPSEVSPYGGSFSAPRSFSRSSMPSSSHLPLEHSSLSARYSQEHDYAGPRYY